MIEISYFIEVPDESWVHPSLYTKSSEIHGTGVFCKEAIPKNSIVIRWGGVILSQKDIDEGKGVDHTNVVISEEFWISAISQKYRTTDDFVNHSCNPNIGMLSDTILITIRDIFPGEEITADYSTWINNDEYVMKSECLCGASNCRHTIRGSDWKTLSVQNILLPYFSPVLKRRLIRELISTY